MPTNVDVPPLGESVTEAVLLRWLKKDGDYVNMNDPLAELETDKANVDLTAPAAGMLRRTTQPGETVHIGQTIGRVEEGSAATSTTPGTQPPPPKPAAAGRPARRDDIAEEAPPPPPPAAPAPAPAPQPAMLPEDMRPSVRHLVAENMLDPAAIAATGPGGRYKGRRREIRRRTQARRCRPRQWKGNRADHHRRARGRGPAGTGHCSCGLLRPGGRTACGAPPGLRRHRLR